MLLAAGIAAVTAVAVTAATTEAIVHQATGKAQPIHLLLPSVSRSGSPLPVATEIPTSVAVKITADSTGPGGVIVAGLDPVVVFAPGKYELSTYNKADLRTWANLFKGLIKQKIIIYSYGDPGGTAANDKLALERARAVVSFLKDQGIRPALLSVVNPRLEKSRKAYDSQVFIYLPKISDINMYGSSGSTDVVVVSSSSYGNQVIAFLVSLFGS